MYQIKKESYGVKLIFNGFIQADEMNKWLTELRGVVPGLGNQYHVFIDIREMKTLPADSQGPMIEGQSLLKNSGMDKSVVILEGIVTAMQFKRLMKKVGKDKNKKYIDSSANPLWETAGVRWLVDGKDPDRNLYM